MIILSWNSHGQKIFREKLINNFEAGRCFSKNGLFNFILFTFRDHWFEECVDLQSATYSWRREEQSSRRSIPSTSPKDCPWAFFVATAKETRIEICRHLKPATGNEILLIQQLSRGRVLHLLAFQLL